MDNQTNGERRQDVSGISGDDGNLRDALDGRLPKSQDFQILYHNGESFELPYLIRLIVCAAMNRTGPNCVFIVPQPEMVAYFTAVFTALLETERHFTAWLDDFARHGLKMGQRVQMLPTGKVYEYAGLKEYWVQIGEEKIVNKRFALKLLSVKGNGGTISLPISELLRLVPTEKARP